ncbi:MAG: hypothetical protein LBJ59_02085 [Zoogloeaceae bacterium]|jgi:hypothetical protein|nr:hypothetical protein [Zoogloeaceae bacterium]
MKTVLIVFALVVLALVLPVFMAPKTLPEGFDRNLPWQITLDAAGNSAVFGLTPGQSRLADARALFGGDFDVAVIAASNQVGALEVDYAQRSFGMLLARLILTLEATPEEIDAMRERALKREYKEGSTKKFTLHPDDRARAEDAVIRAISLIPNARLDEETITRLFGKAAETLPEGKTLTHYLYPDKGLDIVIDEKGRDILQYVAPGDFDARIRAPLEQAPSAPDARREDARQDTGQSRNLC